MSRTKLSLLLGLTLLLAIPLGLAQAQEAVPISANTATAVISDDTSTDPAGLSSVITYALTGVASPMVGTAYEGWLVSADGSAKLSTGVMTVGADGSIQQGYVSPTGENLIAGYSKVLITIEPVPDTDPGPSNIVAYNGEVAAAGMAHIRHLLVAWPAGASKGILTNLNGQLSVALDHARLARQANTIGGIKAELEQVINAIEGSAGANYGDVDGDGTVTNPGDGVGVLAHAADREHATFAAEAVPTSTTMKDNAALVEASGARAADWATQARDALLTARTQTSASFAQIYVANAVSLLSAALNGYDIDGDGIVDQGGAAQAYVAAQRMATYVLQAGAPVVPATPTPSPTPSPTSTAAPTPEPTPTSTPAKPAGPYLGSLSVGDSAVGKVVEGAVALAIVLGLAGGLLLVARRRSDTAA